MSFSQITRLPFKMLLMVVLVAAPVAAQPSIPPGDPLLQDAMTYALDQGVDFEEAVHRFGLQDLAGRLESVLADREWATFGGLWIQHTPDFRVIVQFTRGGQAAIERHVGNGRLAKVVEVRPAQATYAQLETAQQLAIFATQDLGIRRESGINVRANRAEIYVLDRAELADALVRAGIELPAHVEVIEVPQLSEDQAEIYAGVSLSTCTAGWSVKNSSGTLGIVTAGHCGSSQSYGGVSLPFKTEAFSGACDVQWHTDSTYTAVAKFIGSSPASPRTLTATKSRSNQAVGDFVCKWGMTTGYTCGYISDKNYLRTTVPNATATYIRVHQDGVTLTVGGDSGGPWFNANTGYGVTNCRIGDDACYMAINYVSSCLGLTVLIQ